MDIAYYKGYTAEIKHDDERLYHGRVVGIKDIIAFHDATLDRATQAFHESVDDYLDFCKERDDTPCPPHPAHEALVRMALCSAP